MARPEKPTIRALTGLRFFAALHVLLLHAALPLTTGAPLLITNFVGSGYIGVSFFFVLSGFILTYNYFDETHRKNINMRSFWVARFARVAPVYFVGLILWMPIFFFEVFQTNVGSPFDVLTFFVGGTIVAFLLVQAWYPSSVYFLNPPGWSLSVECFFYILFPALARPLRRFGEHGIVIAGLVMWLVSLSLSTSYLIVNPDGVGAGSAQTEVFWLDVLKFNPLVRLPEFIIGMVAGRYYLMKRTSGGFSSSLHTYIGALLISSVLVLSSFVPYPLLHNGLLAPLYAYFIFCLAKGEGRIAVVLSTPALVLLGEASYSLYLLHLPVARWMLKGSSILGLSTSNISYFLVYSISAILLSIVVLRLIEEPARKYIRARISARGI